MATNKIISLIKSGESQTLDFKFQITNSKKIAKTLVAFANTDGGRLLIGVKDNGSIAGVRSDEEYYMVEAAAQLYSKPSISFDAQIHIIEGKQIVEIVIPKSENTLHSAPNEENKYLVYVRRNDENFLANKIYLDVWRKQKQLETAIIEFGETEKFLIQYLEENDSITLSKLCKLNNINRNRAEKVLTNFALAGILEFHFSQKGICYQLNNQALTQVLDK